MIVINSAAYVDSEFRNELGAIPPCLLPLGNKKLIEHQVASLGRFEKEKVVVSLPSSYDLTHDELNLINKLNIEIICVPDSFTLAEALVYILNVASNEENHLRLLHGDTLILDLPNDLDVIAVGEAITDYNWECERSDPGKDPVVWSGYFAFSNKRSFLRSLALSKGNFITAVRVYSNEFFLKTEICNEWYDLGHINTYFNSRSKITTQRSFNSLNILDGVLYKSGQHSHKIDAEKFWYESIPPSIKKYTPQLIDSGYDCIQRQKYYAIEYLPYLPLNELFVNGRNPSVFWRSIFHSLNLLFRDLRNACKDSLFDGGDIKRDAMSLISEKTLSRLNCYAVKTGCSLKDTISVHNGKQLTISGIADHCIAMSLNLPIYSCVLHGDLCFSNILFDSRSNRLKIIDPRGVNYSGKCTIYGDQKYDYAKIAHSVIGLYDFIISGRYILDIDADGYQYIKFQIDERIVSIQEYFLIEELIDGISMKDIMPLVVLLFLSMLPLHEDSPKRQQAMLLNSVRLYKIYCA